MKETYETHKSPSRGKKEVEVVEIEEEEKLKVEVEPPKEEVSFTPAKATKKKLKEPTVIPEDLVESFAGVTKNLPEGLGLRNKGEKVCFHPRQLHIIDGVNYRQPLNKSCKDFKELKASMGCGWMESKHFFLIYFSF